MGFRPYIAMQIAGKKKPPDGVASSTASTGGIMANVNPNSNTSASQRKKIADFLQAGMPIETIWLRVQNRDGKWVRVGEYRLAANDAAQAGVVA